MIGNELGVQIKALSKELFSVEVEPEITRPSAEFGDFSTNVALQLAKKLGKQPREVADSIAAKLKEYPDISEVLVAGPGFINIRLNDDALIKATSVKPRQSKSGKTIVAEYSDPNPFKVLHAGHLYTTLVGDAIANLMEHASAKVHRVNFGGDVGRHVGQTMWSIIQELGGEYPEKLSKLAEDEKLDWISARYVAGTAAYETDEAAKKAIIAANKRVYQLHAEDDHDSPFAQIYWTCRQWSYDGFDNLYKSLGISAFEKYYPESMVAELGLKTVRQHIGDVYEESEGAIIFRGEKYGLFTQVFITSEGLPTYAGKDVGLIYGKYQDFAPDQSFIITDVAQKDHLSVVMKSIEQYAPELVAATTHYTHGQIKMTGGIKMSSRKGNILRATDILDAAHAANKLNTDKDNDQTTLAAVKYAFLKNRIGGDIVYDPAESVAIEGNSGPYLQYAHARARSILSKSQVKAKKSETLDPSERILAAKLGEFPEVIEKAVAELLPHHVCSYLYELAQVFNRFYENSRIIDDRREASRLWLVGIYADTLKEGLGILGISAPDRM